MAEDLLAHIVAILSDHLLAGSGALDPGTAVSAMTPWAWPAHDAVGSVWRVAALIVPVVSVVCWELRRTTRRTPAPVAAPARAGSGARLHTGDGTR